MMSIKIFRFFWRYMARLGFKKSGKTGDVLKKESKIYKQISYQTRFEFEEDAFRRKSLEIFFGDWLDIYRKEEIKPSYNKWWNVNNN